MKIGLLTAFSQMVEHFSLTSVVLDQARMIHHAGHTPVLITMENFTWDAAPEWLEIRPLIPFFHKKDYISVSELLDEHVPISEIVRDCLVRQSDLEVIFTHDVIFTGWELPINLGVRAAAPFMSCFWLHWIHSVPGGMKKDFWRLPVNGKLVYPNYTDRMRCAEHFCVHEDLVEVIPHSLDPRNFIMQTDLAKSIVSEYNLLEADFVQTYPVPTDRMEHKGIEQVIDIISHIKRHGKSVKLVVCNSWCNTPETRAKVRKALLFAASKGLNDREVIFTSTFDAPQNELGVAGAVVRDLMAVSNLFICPTKSETFGLTIAEAALSGQMLVLNSNLPCIPELAGMGNALFFTFGSMQQSVNSANWDAFYSDIARIIIHRSETEYTFKAKTHYRKNYNMDVVWRKISGCIRSYLGTPRVTVEKHGGAKLSEAAVLELA